MFSALSYAPVHGYYDNFVESTSYSDMDLHTGVTDTILTQGMGLIMLQDEMASYVDHNDIFTIAGNIKNEHALHVIPILVLHIQDDGAANTIHTVHVPYDVIPAGGELPFMAKIPDASDAAHLIKYDLDVKMAPPHYVPVTLDVMYDDTLVVHPDGHLTGFAVNSGNHTLYDPVIWAVVHGTDDVLDVARSMPLGVIAAGQTVGFSMYPDPAINDEIVYYSCFAPSDVSIHPLTAQRDNQEYRMRYDSGAWLYRPVFGDDGTYVTLQTTNSFPFETYANVEIPAVTRNETFSVLQNDMVINHTQSVDETGTWHVAFTIRERSQDVITIRGFEQGKTLPVLIPEYIRDDMYAWATVISNDSADTIQAYDSNNAKIAYALQWLADHQRLPEIPQMETDNEGGVYVPFWFSMLIGWWHDSKISDEDALASIAYAIDAGMIYAVEWLE